MDSSSIQENVEALQLIPQQQPGVEEEQLDIQIMPIDDHADASATLERLSIFKASRRLLMAYISNSLGGNIGSKDQLIAHGLINGVKLDYGGIIFNDLAAKLTNSIRHTSSAYTRFISLILKKALGDSYVLYDEIGFKIPIMGNLIFNLDPSLLEVLISSHMVRVCQSEPDPAVVSEDVSGILLFDNVLDGSPSIDSNLNEIIQKWVHRNIKLSHFIDVLFRVPRLSICQPYGLLLIQQESDLEWIYRQCEIGDVLDMYLLYDDGDDDEGWYLE
ncbi:hypothetical protein Tco_1427728 [Tanacetum coccineum]